MAAILDTRIEIKRLPCEFSERDMDALLGAIREQLGLIEFVVAIEVGKYRETLEASRVL